VVVGVAKLASSLPPKKPVLQSHHATISLTSSACRNTAAQQQQQRRCVFSTSKKAAARGALAAVALNVAHGSGEENNNSKKKKKLLAVAGTADVSAASAVAAIRRGASFTCSAMAQTKNVNVSNGHAGVTLTTPTRNAAKVSAKFTLGRSIGKTLKFLKEKMDMGGNSSGGADRIGKSSSQRQRARASSSSSSSTSALTATRDECRRWQESFLELLNHKYGSVLFRQFLKHEFSAENLDFWQHCEQFKTLKPGKRLAAAQEIYTQFIADNAVTEVNLDASTKVTTREALEQAITAAAQDSTCEIHVDIFDLAQYKIAQLMEKDSYQRFLKSEPYLEVLNEQDVTRLGSCAATGSGQNQDVAGGGSELTVTSGGGAGFLRSSSVKSHGY